MKLEISLFIEGDAGEANNDMQSRRSSMHCHCLAAIEGITFA